MQKVSLLTPNGWALRGYTDIAYDGATLGDLGPNLAGDRRRSPSVTLLARHLALEEARMKASMKAWAIASTTMKRFMRDRTALFFTARSAARPHLPHRDGDGRLRHRRVRRSGSSSSGTGALATELRTRSTTPSASS